MQGWYGKDSSSLNNVNLMQPEDEAPFSSHLRVFWFRVSQAPAEVSMEEGKPVAVIMWSHQWADLWKNLHPVSEHHEYKSMWTRVWSSSRNHQQCISHHYYVSMWTQPWQVRSLQGIRWNVWLGSMFHSCNKKNEAPVTWTGDELKHGETFSHVHAGLWRSQLYEGSTVFFSF